MARADQLTVEAVDGLASVHDEWERLARAAGSPFCSPRWIEPAAQHLQPGAERLDLVVRADDRLVGVAVLLAEPPFVTFAGSTISDRTGPVCAEADRAAVGAAVRAHLDEVLAARSVVVSMASHPADPPGLAADVTGEEGCPVAEVGRPDYLEGAPARRRRRALAQACRFAEQTGVDVVDVDDPDGLELRFDDLVGLHALRFPSSTLLVGARRRLVRDALGRFAADGELLLRFLEVDGRPVAAMAGFRWNGDDWFYVVGRDRSVDAPIGRHLFALTVERARQEGRQAFHLLRGDEPYKDWWATRRERVVTCSWVVA